MAPMRTGCAFAIPLLLCCALASAEAAPDQAPEHSTEHLIRSKPAKTTINKRCPDGYELVIRANGSRGCAKEITPPNN
jgi:hypothetical protein